MARKTKTVVIDAEGRDKGKTFLLTEMSAFDADRWANRCVAALINAGAQIPDGIAKLGVAGLVSAGFPALLNLQADSVQPLLDEMLKCIQYSSTGQAPFVPIFVGDSCQIEEVATFWKLRGAVFELHTGFSLAAALSTTA